MSPLLLGGLRDCFWDGSDDYLKKSTSMCSLFSQFLFDRGSWGTLLNHAHPSLGTGAWPESWTPTHRDTFIHSDENHCVGHMHTFSSPSGLLILWGPHLFSPCLSHLWAGPNAEKVPTRQRFTSTQIFLRACGKMVLVLSKLGPWTQGRLWGGSSLRKPRLLATVPGTSRLGAGRPIGTNHYIGKGTQTPRCLRVKNNVKMATDIQRT